MLNINTVTPEFKGTNFLPNTMAVAEEVNTPNSVIASDLTKLLDSLNECILIINSPTIQEIDDTIHAIQTRIGDVEDIIEGGVYAPKNHSSSTTDYGLLTGANYGHVKTIDNLTTTDTDAGKLLSARQGSVIKGLINGLLNEIDVNQNEIDELQNDVDGIQTDINGIHGDIDGIHTDISGLQNDINSNTEEGNVIKGLINGLNSEVGGIQTEVGEIQSEISGLQTALDGKVDDSQVLTNVPLNAKFTDTVYNHPGTHPASMIAESTSRRFVSDTEKANWNAKWDYNENIIKAVKVDNAVNADTVNGKTVAENVPVGAKFTDTVYTHPASHPASMITESSTKRFVSDSEKSTWNNKSDTDTVTTINGKTGAISKADIVALGIPAQDTNTTYSEITTAEIDTGTASTLRTITGRRVKYILDKVQGWIGGIQNDIDELQNATLEIQQNLVTVDSNRVVRYNGKALYIPGTNTGTVETSASTSSVTLTVDISGIHEISLEGVGSRKAILLSTSPDPANINMGNVLLAHMKEDADMHKMQTFQGLIEKGETLYAYVTTNTEDYYYHDIAYLVENGVFAVLTVDVLINVTHPIFIKAGSH